MSKALYSDRYANSVVQFCDNWTPEKIKIELDKYVIGQDSVKKECAMFFYYHLARTIKPSLPVRNMIIAGPPGTGKTEIWRVLNKLFPWANISIIDGSHLTWEGYKGESKLCNVVHDNMILVIDEFDKYLASDNAVPLTDNRMGAVHKAQDEMLKLLEDEYSVADGKGDDDDDDFDVDDDGYAILFSCDEKKVKYYHGISVCCVGSFEQVMQQVEQNQVSSQIGFTATESEFNPNRYTLTSKDFLDAGVKPEIISRIATICSTKPLSVDNYMKIIYNPNGSLMQMCSKFGVSINKFIDFETLTKLIKKSIRDRTGVRYVLKLLEKRLFDQCVYTHGIDLNIL